MPEIDLVPVPSYEPLNPYHFEIDNLPIDALKTQMFLVNAQVDLNANAIRDAKGTAGSISNRLSQSIEEDGTLKSEAIDDALHAIAEHLDGGGYVRMTDDEREKLSLIEAEATDISIELETASTSLIWPTVNKTFRVADSDTVTWRISSNTVFADTAFSDTLVVTKHYNITPANQNTGTPDNKSYKTSTVNTPYKSGSLRVYMNGARLNTSTAIGGFYYTESDADTGKFVLNKAKSTSDVLRIDFDQPIT